MALQALAETKRREEVKSLANLSAFSQAAWPLLKPVELSWNWHHDLICEYLMLAKAGKVRRLIITVPPRSTKSTLVSVMFPAWAWTETPEMSFIVASYSGELSTEMSVLRRNLLQSDWYRQRWPGKVEFALDQNQKTHYENLRQGQMIATSITGTVTGRGCDCLIIDDPLNPKEAFSDLEREAANRNFDSTFRSRLNDASTGSIVCIMQRLHERDLVGHILDTEAKEWTVVSLPTEAEVEEDVTFPISGRVVHRSPGDLLHPERFPRTWVELEKVGQGSYVWAGQHQQRPAPMGGAIFKSQWFQYYDMNTLPDKFRAVVISLDTAYEVKKTADFSVATVWGESERGFYLLHLWRGRAEFPQLREITQELARSWRPDAVVVEKAASGRSLLHELRQGTNLPVVGWPVDKDKSQRAHAVTPLFEAGRVFFPQPTHAPWLQDYLHEMELFPGAAHDDQVDSTTMGLGYMRRSGTHGVIEVWREMYEQKMAAESKLRDPGTAVTDGDVRAREMGEEQKGDSLKLHSSVYRPLTPSIGSTGRVQEQVPQKTTTTACPKCGATGLRRYSEGYWECCCGAKGRDQVAQMTVTR